MNPFLFSAWIVIPVVIGFVCGRKPLSREKLEIDAVNAGHTAIEIVKTTKDPDAKWRAIRILGSLRYEPAVPVLKESLSDSHHYVRANAARALGDLREKSAATLLIEVLRKEENGGVIQQISLALANLRCTDALPTLKTAAKHEDTQTRAWVLQAIGRMGSKRDVAFLAGYLADASQTVQEAAARAIEQIAGTDFGFPKNEGPYVSDEALERAKRWWAKNKRAYGDG
jgi:HEAT repeat protein